jgi:uncharacterized protein (DUF58 family)
MRAIAKAFEFVSSRRGDPPQRDIVLVRRRIYILPTRFGVLFAVMLLLMLTGSANYALSLGYVLTFLLAALAISTILHTFRNLAGLRVSALRTAPVFAGDVAQFRLSIANDATADRYSLALIHGEREFAVVDVPAEGAVIATAAIATTTRGVFKPGRLTISTRFPLGLFRAWAYLQLDTRCIVYPRPASATTPLRQANVGASDGGGQGRGIDDFAGLRRYVMGDSPRQLAWKAVARDQGLLTKQFLGDAEGELWLRLDDLPHELHFEEKLSRLARCVIQAHAAGQAYGLDLGATVLPLGRGGAHRERCLEALALCEPRSASAGVRTAGAKAH